MAKRRSYDQFCGVARALDQVSERWTLLIVRNLMLGPRRYSDLMTELPGITTNLLAARLRAMEEIGLVARQPGPPARYELTALGAALEPVVVELRAGERRFELAFEDADLHLKEREAVRPQLIVTGPLEAFQAWLFGGAPPAELQRAGKLTVDGDVAAWRAVQAAFRPNDWKSARSDGRPRPS